MVLKCLEEAPNEFFWECNAYVDTQATKAREEYSLEELKNRENYVFPSVKAGCKIAGHIENSSLYTVLKHTINGRELKSYLLEKYSWTEGIFSQIDWSSHYRALNTVSRRQQVTLIKFLHGWLATNKQRYRENKFPTDNCTLCGQVETSDHLFSCNNERMKALRDSSWEKFTMDLCVGTPPDFQAIFLSGLGTLRGRDTPSEQTSTEWPVELRQAYESQEEIGWNQVWFGRILKAWKELTQEDRNISRSGWNTNVIKRSWTFGLELWTVRNQLVHGTTNRISILERVRGHRLITVMYRELLPQLDTNMRDVFQRSEKELLELPYHSQLAWLGKLEFLFPVWNRNIETTESRTVRVNSELEHMALAPLGTNII